MFGRRNIVSTGGVNKTGKSGVDDTRSINEDLNPVRSYANIEGSPDIGDGLVTERLPLSEVIASAIELSQSRIENAKVSLSVQPQPSEVIITADRLRLAQVFSNLLDNAAKYTEPRGTITIATVVTDQVVSVAIRDTGIGIPAEQMPYLFELFTQIDRSLKRPQSGLGIGLAMAHRLVKMHSGSLEAASAGLGHGATFTVRLPLDIL